MGATDSLCLGGITTMRPLFDDVPERPGVLPNSSVPCGDGHERWRLSEQFDRRKMQRIERANRFNGKRPASASEHRVRHVNEVAAALESMQSPDCGSFLRGRQPTSHTRAKEGSR